MTDKTVSLEAPEIPQTHIEFAEAVAQVAREYGMDQFTMTYRPNFISEFKLPSMLHGELKITYRGVDGRGRPNGSLKIILDATLAVDICHVPESCS